MRLFFVNMHQLWGGQSAVVVLLASELARRGHEIIVAGLKGSELIQRSEKLGLRVYGELELRRGFRPLSFMRDQDRLKKLWSDFKPDGILTNGAQDTWACALAKRRLKTPAFLVRWRHNSFKISPHAFNKWLYSSLIDHVVVSSSEISPFLTQENLVPPDRITVFPPTTNLDPYLNPPAIVPEQSLRKQLGLKPEELLVLSVGRLAPEKGHDTLIKAWAKLRETNSNAHLAIAGHGSTEGDLQDLIAKFNLKDRVHLLGFRNDIPALYAQADAAALAPTAGESFGIALLEAYAAGKACVATDVGGVRDLVVNDETGYLVKAGDSDAIAAALEKLLSDPARRAQFASTGKRRVLDQFTPEKLGDRAEALFTKLKK